MRFFYLKICWQKSTSNLHKNPLQNVENSQFHSLYEKWENWKISFVVISFILHAQNIFVLASFMTSFWIYQGWWRFIFDLSRIEMLHYIYYDKPSKLLPFMKWVLEDYLVFSLFLVLARERDSVSCKSLFKFAWIIVI